jgi:hypothetical protein
MRFFSLFLILFTAFSLWAQPRRSKLPAQLSEISGLVRLPDGSVWALNDGGNAAELLRLDIRTGNILEARTLPLRNRDWEDLTADPQGNLYIGDFGNNLNNRKDLRIYIYQPYTGHIDSILFEYPDQTSFPPKAEEDRKFDCEAMIFAHDSLHLFTKSRFKSQHYTKQYVLPAQPGHYTAHLRDSLSLHHRVVSGAGISADGKTLALTSYIVGLRLRFLPFSKATIWYFTDPGNGDFLKSKPRHRRLPKFLLARQFESVMETAPGRWMAANESIGPQKAALWRLRQ